MTPEEIILIQRKKEMSEGKMKVSITSHDKKVSFTISDEATWREALDNFLALLDAIGYRIDEDKFLDWANTTDVFI